MTTQELKHPPLEVPKVPNPLEETVVVPILMQESTEVMINVAVVMVAATEVNA